LMAKTSPIRRSTMRSERQGGVQKPPKRLETCSWSDAANPARVFSFGDPRKQPERRAGRQSSTSRPLRAVETQFRSSAPACDKANFQKSGIRSKTGVARRGEGPAHPEYDRKCCDRHKTDRRGLWWTERVGVPSFGTVRPRRIDPCDGSSASAGSHLPRKETSTQNARRSQRHRGRSPAQHRKR
jgi:hypothetical protein